MTSGSEPLGNPFTWAFIPYRSIRVLLEYFYDINFASIKLAESDRWKGTYTLTIEDMVDIFYIHYHLNPLREVPYKENNDISMCNIWEYIVDKYMARARRMVRNGERPAFLILQNNSCGTTDEFIDLYNAYPESEYNICWGAFDDCAVEARPNLIRIGAAELPRQVVNRCNSSIISLLFKQ
jgi:hypothetical protein